MKIAEMAYVKSCEEIIDEMKEAQAFGYLMMHSFSHDMTLVVKYGENAQIVFRQH